MACIPSHNICPSLHNTYLVQALELFDRIDDLGASGAAFVHFVAGRRVAALFVRCVVVVVEDDPRI